MLFRDYSTLIGVIRMSVMPTVRHLYHSLFANKHSIRDRLRFYFIILSLVPLLILGSVCYVVSKSTIDNSVFDYSKKLIYQTAENIDIRLENYKANMMQIITNPEVVSYLMNIIRNTHEQSHSNGKISDTILTTKLASYISTLQESKAISFISNKHYIKGTYYSPDNVLMGNGEFYKQIMEKGNEFSWFPTRQALYGYDNDSHKVNVFSLGKQVYNINNMGVMNLVAVIDIREEVLSDIFRKGGSENIEGFIIDENGTILAHPNQEMLFKNISELFLEQDIEKLLSSGTEVSTFETRYMEESVFTNVVKLSTNDWKVINVVKTEYLYKQSSQVVKIIILMIFFCIALSIIAAHIVSWGISKPIKNMMGTMRKVVAGDLNVKIEGTDNKSTSDEISVLQESFNYMISKIRELINNVYEEQNQKRILEIKALEAQINPHFLYNTLDTIKWTALFQKANNAAEMASLLSRLLHISLRKGDETVKVSEEVEHVQCYLGIQRFRFDLDIKVNYCIDQEVKDLKVPKLILQPIVENSILHGFSDKEHGGTITINSKRNEEILNIEVIDDGCGMDTQHLETLKESKIKSGESFSGIGLANVDQRIKLICGERYGISIESKKGEGTKVKIILPIIK